MLQKSSQLSVSFGSTEDLFLSVLRGVKQGNVLMSVWIWAKKTESHFSHILSQEFADLLVPNFDCTTTKHGVELHIVTEGQPVHATARRLDPQKLSVAKAEFKRMEELGIIIVIIIIGLVTPLRMWCNTIVPVTSCYTLLCLQSVEIKVS